MNKPEHGSLDWVKICEKSSKVITFIDLAGHERYLKTTVFGMTGHAPDFGMLMVIETFSNMQFNDYESLVEVRDFSSEDNMFQKLLLFFFCASQCMLVLSFFFLFLFFLSTWL